MMRVLVYGGRDYRNERLVFHSLDRLHAKHGICLIIEGGATGADRLARNWAEARSIPFQTFEADWKLLGKRAGPVRNQWMITEGKPDVAVQFQGGRGTDDMRARVQHAGIRVWTVVEREVS